MNWFIKLLGGTRAETISRKRSKNNQRKKHTPAKRNASSPVESVKSSGRENNRKDKKHRSGSTFSNAFSLANRELPGIREADAAFQSSKDPHQEGYSAESHTVSLGPVRGSSRQGSVRRPN